MISSQFCLPSHITYKSHHVLPYFLISVCCEFVQYPPLPPPNLGGLKPTWLSPLTPAYEKSRSSRGSSRGREGRTGLGRLPKPLLSESPRETSKSSLLGALLSLVGSSSTSSLVASSSTSTSSLVGSLSSSLAES